MPYTTKVTFVLDYNRFACVHVYSVKIYNTYYMHSDTHYIQGARLFKTHTITVEYLYDVCCANCVN